MKYCIGIDPGKDCGFAVWNIESGKWETIETLSTIEAENAVLKLHNSGGCFVICEDARQRKFFGNTGRERLQGAGWAKAASARWEDFLKHHGIPHRMQAPGKTWKGAAAGKMWAKVARWPGKTSDHARDAAWLVFEISKSKIEALLSLANCK